MKHRHLLLLVILSFFGLVGCARTAENYGQSQPPLNKVSQGKTYLKSVWQQVIVNNRTYLELVPKGYLGDAIQTPLGVAWIQVPPMVTIGLPTRGDWVFPQPTEPYALYLSDANGKYLRTSNAKEIWSTPLWSPWGSSERAVHTIVELMGSGYWLIFLVANTVEGSPSPFSYELDAINLEDMKFSHITTFAMPGGSFFNYGVNGHYVAYEKSHYDISSNSWLATFVAEDLSNGKTIGLKSDVSKDGSVKFEAQGKWIKVYLNSGQADH